MSPRETKFFTFKKIIKNFILENYKSIKYFDYMSSRDFVDRLEA